LASPWDTISIPAQDATQQRGAATTRREASLGAKGVTNHTTGTRTSKHPDFNPQVTQSTRRHTTCKPDGREHDTHIIHIQGPHSPPLRLDLTTPAKQQTQQQPYGPAGTLGQNSELSPRLARHHPLGEGYGQARSVLGPEQGTEQGMLPRHATQGLQQKPVPSQHKETPGNLKHRDKI